MMSGKGNTVKHNETHEFYEKYFDKNSYESFKYDVGAFCTRRAILRKVTVTTGTALEVGIGIASLLEQLQNFDCYGIDIAEKTVVATDHLFKEKGLRGSFLQADATSLPFPDNYFDVIVTSHVFEHIEQDELAMAEVARTLKPGGKFIIFVPGSMDGKAPAIEWETCRHYRNYNLQEMQRLAASTKGVLKLTNISYPHKTHNLVWNRLKTLFRWANYPIRKFIMRDSKGFEARIAYQKLLLPVLATSLDYLDLMTNKKESFLLGTKFNVLAVFEKQA